MNKIFKLQAELQSGYSNKGMTDPSSLSDTSSVGTSLDYIQQMNYFLSEEVNELMHEIGGGRQALKPWSSLYEDSRSAKYVSTPKVKSEAIDMLCFAINICLASGINANNVEEEYVKVLKKNTARQLDNKY